MPHRNTVIHSDGVELFCNTTRLLNLTRDQLPHILKVDMTRHKLGKRVDHRNDRFLKILILHSGGTPQRAGSGHISTVGGGSGTIFRHLWDSGDCLLKWVELNRRVYPPTLVKTAQRIDK